MALEDRRRPFTWRHHPKRLKLLRKLGPAGVLAIEDLWDHVAQTKGLRHDGRLRRMDLEDIAIAATWAGNPAELINALLECRLLDHLDGEVEFAVHDWEDHQEYIAQYDDYCVTQQLRAVKGWDKRRGATGTPPASQPDTEGEPEPVPNECTNRPTDRPTNQPTNQGEPIDPAEITRIYNVTCFPAGMPRAHKASKTRCGHFNARTRDMLHTIVDWAMYLKAAADQRFLCGENKRGWRADLGWLVESPEHLAKVMEGRYTKGQERPRPVTAAGRVLARLRERKENDGKHVST